MNREEAEDFIYKSYLKAEKFQKYEEKDAQKRRPELTRELIRQLCHTEAVVITGSKGKGSVANMIAQILMPWKKVGLMTSPHQIDFCERFRVNGKPISDSDFVQTVSELLPQMEELEKGLAPGVCISPMGIQAAVALSFFEKQNCSFQVFECGKGAQYDDVNNIPHAYAVINCIFPEHLRELGENIVEIARDKAHVIAGGQKCVYVAPQEPQVLDVIIRRAERFQVPLKIYGRDFRAEHIRYEARGMCFDVVTEKKHYTDLRIPLLGEHQARNCALALALCEDVLPEMDLPKVYHQLRELHWPGRMEIVSERPLLFLDACIHGVSCRNVKEVLRNYPDRKWVTVIGIPDDKDYVGVATEMAKVSENILLTKSKNPHYVFTQKQKVVLEEKGIHAIWTESVSEALEQAKILGDSIVVLGTTSVVAEVEKLYRK